MVYRLVVCPGIVQSTLAWQDRVSRNERIFPLVVLGRPTLTGIGLAFQPWGTILIRQGDTDVSVAAESIGHQSRSDLLKMYEKQIQLWNLIMTVAVLREFPVIFTEEPAVLKLLFSENI
ncbi:MAG: hypothetical protein ACQEQV_09085 [Fibrobacterota bacterium]